MAKPPYRALGVALRIFSVLLAVDDWPAFCTNMHHLRAVAPYFTDGLRENHNSADGNFNLQLQYKAAIMLIRSWIAAGVDRY